MAKIKWKAEDIKLSDIQEYSGSIREYTMVDLEKMKATLEVDGLIEPLVLNKDNVLIDGLLRYNAMIELGWDSCTVTKPLKQLTPEEHAEAYLRKNRNIAGVDDYAVLREHFSTEELQDGGFSIDEIQDIQLDSSDIEIDEKPKRHLFELYFDSKEDMLVADELLHRLKDKHTTEEKFETNLIAFIRKHKGDVESA